ncbi:DUF4998 domain-containing protein [Chitinophaga arvensicola]|uniref:DUF5013 domain-containing protein n=1 Tax=Chitinophaga arvensicola TaxID=29529 RepID=A0A1I0S7C8_9BACT|nr:DUF4998 domain-containing protein [Chitinophaga arvensicola]SEW51638.1 protein of unknown function [Chitinophaga arvensicola]
MRILSYLLLCCLVFSACSKPDDYKKYITGGEILYTGKADSLQIHPGRNRIQLSWLLISDPKINKSKIYWNNRLDSLIIDIKRTSGVDTIRYFVSNLEERAYTFEVFNYDRDGNSSVRSEVTGFVYGHLYEDALLSRAFSSAEMKEGNAVINWVNIDTTGGITGMQLQYTSADQVNHDTIIRAIPEGQVTVLPNYLSMSSFRYRTLYLPDKRAVDTFYTAFETKAVKEDITRTYIRNAGSPFLRDDNQSHGDRFGQLKDWQSNSEAAKNGTYDNIGGTGRLTLWIWGNGPITNGKIYQTFTLPAGDYRFEADISNVDNTLQNTWLLVAAGNQLPDVEQVSTALGSAKLTDNNNKYASAGFSLTATTTVTVGFTGTLSDPGEQTIRVNKVLLIRDK